MKPAITIAFALLAVGSLHAAELESFTVQPQSITEYKAVFATVESTDVVPARSRISGTIGGLDVDEGDVVTSGQVIGFVGDEKLTSELRALDAQLSAARSRAQLTRTELNRVQELFGRGAVAKAMLDTAQTTNQVAQDQARAAQEARAVTAQRLADGTVLAPVDGTVLKVSITAGSVVLPGDTVATIAAGGYQLRLRVPEAYARYLQEGDVLSLGTETADDSGNAQAVVSQVYPELDNGRVVADLAIANLEGHLIGQRLPVRMPVGLREAIVIPRAFVSNRFGIDFVRIQGTDGQPISVAVKLGRDHSTPELSDGVEVLSGLRAGDVMVTP